MAYHKTIKSVSWLVFIVFLITGFFIMDGSFMSVNADEFAGEIVIGDDDEMTGPYATIVITHTQAAADYWKQHNNQITVDGKKYKIKHMLRDNKTNVSVTVSNFNRFVAAGAVIVRTNWTPGGTALMPLGIRNKVPVMVGGYNKKLHVPPNKYLYMAQPSYPGLAAACIKWYKENRFKGPGKMKVGLLLIDSGWGRSSHIPDLYNYLKEDLGVELLRSEFYPVRSKELTAQLMRFRRAKADLRDTPGLW